jgi:phage/plasmid-associated DNA primase
MVPWEVAFLERAALRSGWQWKLRHHAPAQTRVPAWQEKLHKPLKSVVADEERAAELRAMLKSLRNYDNVAAVNSTMAVMQGVLYAPDLFERLNTDVHIVNVRYGIWQLKMGALDVHKPRYLCAYMTDVDYMVSVSDRDE